MIENLFVFDCEVFKYDWLFVFKNPYTKHGGNLIIWNDPEMLDRKSVV